MTAPTQTERLKELLAKACSPLPWREYKNCFYSAVYSGAEPVTRSTESNAPCWAEDAQLIVAAVNALPELLAELEAARREVELLQKQLKATEAERSALERKGISLCCALGTRMIRDTDALNAAKAVRVVMSEWGTPYWWANHPSGKLLATWSLEEIALTNAAAPSANLGGGA